MNTEFEARFMRTLIASLDMIETQLERMNENYERVHAIGRVDND